MAENRRNNENKLARALAAASVAVVIDLRHRAWPNSEIPSEMGNLTSVDFLYRGL